MPAARPPSYCIETPSTSIALFGEEPSVVYGHCLISRALCAWLDWPGLSLPLRGLSGCLSQLWTNDGSSGPSLPSVLPRFIGSPATSDSLLGIVAALSGFALIRFPTGRFASAGPNRVSPVVLMRCLCVLPPSTPSRRSRSLSLHSGPWQASPPRDRFAPGKDPAELA